MIKKGANIHVMWIFTTNNKKGANIHVMWIFTTNVFSVKFHP